jgi:hypothetical protein
MQTDIYKASQARLMTAQQRTAMEEARGLASLGERMKTDPEGVGRLIGRDADFVRANTPTNIMKIMQSIGTRDPLQRELQQAQLGELKTKQQIAQEEAASLASLSEQMKTDPEGVGRMIGQDADFVRRSSPRTIMEISKQRATARSSGQFREETRIGPEGKPILGQVNTATNEFKPYVQPPTTQITGEKAEEATVGKSLGERQIETLTAAAKVPIEIAKLNLTERIAGNIATGKWADVKGSIVAGAKALGISDDAIRSISGLDPNLPAAQQQLTSIFSSLTIGLLGPGGFPTNNFSNKDLEFLNNIYPRITDEPEAIKLKIEVMRRIERQKADKASEWRTYQKRERDAGRKPSFYDFEQDYLSKLNDLAKDGKDVFSDLIPRIPAAATGGARPAAPLSGTAGGLNWRVEQ